MPRLALVVHPVRDIGQQLGTLQGWAREHGAEVVQLPVERVERVVAPPGDVDACDLVVAIGGDGTVLTAVRAAAHRRAPVLGVSCGSLGALTAVAAGGLAGALDRWTDGDWEPRALPALAIATPDGPQGWAVNDVVVVRRGPTQITVELRVDGERYARMAGDGVVVSTPLGSSAYSMGAGGPVVATGSDVFLCTPLAMHGGCAPPLVVPGDAVVEVLVDPGRGEFDVEHDGHRARFAGRSLRLTLDRRHATLVGLGDGGGDGVLSALRRRRVLVDSPRILADAERSEG
jgi:NAD+ kinase